MKLSHSYNYDFKGTNTEMLFTVSFDKDMQEVEEIESIQIVVNSRIVADITNIVHDWFDEIEDKIFEDNIWRQLAEEKNHYSKTEMF